jgi:hypothetical protein
LPHFSTTLLNALGQLLSQVNSGTTFQQAEVVLLLISHLYQSIPVNLREKTEGNPYAELLRYMLSVDFFAFNHRVVSALYLENLIRYQPYLAKTPGFFASMTEAFFSERALLNRDEDLARRSAYLMNRMVERFLPAASAGDEPILQMVA